MLHGQRTMERLNALAEKKFYVRRYAWVTALCGGSLLLFALWASVSHVTRTPPAGSFGCAALLIFLGIWQQRMPYLVLGADYLQTRLAPVRGWHSVLYSEILLAERKGTRISIMYRQHTAAVDSKPRKITMNLSQMRPRDVEECMEYLRERLIYGVQNL